MTKWNRHVVAFVCLSLASFIACGSRTARGAEDAGWAPAQEESLLVATREEADNEERATDDEIPQSDDDALEPVAESSDRTPDLATPDDEQSAAPRVGANLTRLGRSQQAQAMRGSANSARSSRVGRAATTSRKEMRRGTANRSRSSAIESVRFQGIMVGEANKQELIAAWGEPIESVDTTEGSVLAYDIDPFQAVEVLIGRDDMVKAIKVALAAPLEPGHLAEQLSLNEFRPVTAMDDADQPLGQAFPERGVLFMFPWSNTDALAGDGATKPVVSHVVLQQVDPLAFAMRAENAPTGAYTEKIADLKTAVELDPHCAHAHWQLAKIYLATGQADKADDAAREACQIDPDNAKYQLCRASTQELLGQYDNAVVAVRSILDRDDLQPIDKAQALHQMGRLASLGDVEIASKAISFHTRSIEMADTLASSDNGKERRAAKHLLVEAHMAVAEEIARQSFNQKVQNLSLWIGRASGLAEDFITNDGGNVELRLVIAQHALASLASFRPTLDPAPWVTEAEDAAKDLFAQSDDELWQARIKWELGLAYLHALRVEHVRRETQTALRYGEKAVDNLAAGAASRQAVHSSEQLVGQLYFQMGAVHAVHQLDHVKAAQWYDKAEPLLTGTRPASELYAPRREGEMLVSMGVTFWQLGEQDRALQLTQNGVNLVESAVEHGILAKSALAIPYGNLATMYQKVGENTTAAKYAALAKTVAPAATSSPAASGPPRVGHRAETARKEPSGTRRTAQRARGSAMR
jgi:tetratricopeptide (TPR) repeat protein